MQQTDVPIHVVLRGVHIENALSAPKVYHGTHLSVIEDGVTVAHYPQIAFPFAPLPSGPFTNTTCGHVGQNITNGLGACCEDACALT